MQNRRSPFPLGMGSRHEHSLQQTGRRPEARMLREQGRRGVVLPLLLRSSARSRRTRHTRARSWPTCASSTSGATWRLSHGRSTPRARDERPSGDIPRRMFGVYLPGARRPLPSCRGMNGPLPEGNQYAILLASTLPTSSCLGVSRSVAPLSKSTSASWTWCSLVKREQRMPPLPC